MDSDRACRDDALNIRARSSVGRKTRGRPESGMSVARSAAEVLRDHVVLELEAIDRMYLNVYVPHHELLDIANERFAHRRHLLSSTQNACPCGPADIPPRHPPSAGA